LRGQAVNLQKRSTTSQVNTMEERDNTFIEKEEELDTEEVIGREIDEIINRK